MAAPAPMASWRRPRRSNGPPVSTPAALQLAGADLPSRSARLVLVGPGGGDWTISPTVQDAPARTPDATVTMDAVEFCYLLGNRRDPDSVPHRVEGDPAVAATLLRAVTTLGCD